MSFVREDAGNDPEHLANKLPVSLILRTDIEDRNNHEVTKAMNGPQQHWPKSIQPQENGYVFAPSNDRKLNVSVQGGEFHSEPEWYYMIGHPVDQARGIDGESDLFSPGYFKIELKGRQTAD